MVNNWCKMRLELEIFEYTYYPGTSLERSIREYYMDKIYNLDKKPVSFSSEEIHKKLINKYGYKYKENKELASEYIVSFITEIKGKHLNGKPVTKTDIMTIFDNLEGQVKPGYNKEVGTAEYLLDILVPVAEEEEEKEKLYTCGFEIYASAALNNFIKDKQEFLEIYQVGSDEFAYDYEEHITKGAKSIFGKDAVS